MKDHRLAIVITRALVLSSLLMVPLLAISQAPSDADDEDAQAARAERIAREFEAEARVLTVFDRQGNVLTTIGERDLYWAPVFSPDGTQLAVEKNDLENETTDLWVIDVATGDSTRITSHAKWREEWAGPPVWSPDGRQLAYVGLRNGYEGVYRKASNREGVEELLYQDPGANLRLGDWSMDGRYLSLSTSDGFFEATLYALPMIGDGERAPIEVFHSESQLRVGSFSPDARFLSYALDETEVDEVYVVPFNPDSNAEAASTDRAFQVSDQGGEFVIRSGWRRDGGELYYVAADRGIMAVELEAGSTLELRQPELLFRPSQAIRVDSVAITVSRDGERIVIAVPHAPKLEQITVFDRQGTVLHEVGEPGVYRNPAISPDGNRVAVRRVAPETGNSDIWTFDLTTGEGTPVTNSTSEDNWPIWSPDSSQLIYGSRRGLFSSIYRKAWDGTGDEEQVFQFTPGAFLQVTDWSADGRFLTFHDGCWGVLHVVPLGEQDAPERRAIDWLRDEYQVAQARFSPDARFIAYLTDEMEDDEFQIYVSPFDARQTDGGRGLAPAVQVISDEVLGAVSWREDGKELYYLTADWEVMAVDVSTTPVFQAGTPRLLFSLPGPLPGNPKQWKSVSPDGQRFVFVLNVPVSVR